MQRSRVCDAIYRVDPLTHAMRRSVAIFDELTMSHVPTLYGKVIFL